MSLNWEKHTAKKKHVLEIILYKCVYAYVTLTSNIYIYTHNYVYIIPDTLL